jgi:glutamate-1-semialdehyde 2,1-aminomutase
MIIAIIQARMGSTRLPGKVMKDLAGKSVLAHVVERVSLASKVDGVIVATTTEPEDDVIEKFCKEHKIPVYRGSSADVLKRYADAARFMQTKGKEISYIVRITADCPLMDPAVIDHVISITVNGNYDYASNTLTPTYPDGLDVEVFSIASLIEADLAAQLPSEREHVTPYIKKNEKLRKFNIANPVDLSAFRWTLDQEEDLRFISEVYNKLYKPEKVFRMQDVLNFLKKNHSLTSVNSAIVRDEGYLNSLQEDMMDKKKSESTGITLWKRAKKIIPGGNQLLSKRSEQFLPERWPSYYKKAKGVEIWDLDDRRFIDMTLMGVGACSLGYADDDINAAVISAVQNGSMSTLNSYEEVELAETLIRIHPWAQMVRFARTGGEAAAIAIRIARASTGKDRIAFCGYHGWNDWYLAANLSDDSSLDGHLLPGLSSKGVPRGLKGTALPFNFNHSEELEAWFRKYPGEIGTVIMEPLRYRDPEKNFLPAVRKLCDEHGAVLIFDEVTSGFRMNIGGVHLRLGVNPDLVLLGKSMGNGHPIAAVIGRGHIMDIAQETFMSSTYWTERVGFAAANATIAKMQKVNLPDHLIKTGNYIGMEWRKLISENDLPFLIEDGTPPLIHMGFNHPESLIIQTYITQEMLKKGYLARESVYVSLPHTKKVVDGYIANLQPVFKSIRKNLDAGTLAKKLEVPQALTGFKRLT